MPAGGFSPERGRDHVVRPGDMHEDFADGPDAFRRAPGIFFRRHRFGEADDFLLRVVEVRQKIALRIERRTRRRTPHISNAIR